MKDIILWIALVIVIGAGVWYFTQKADAPTVQPVYTSQVYTFANDDSEFTIQYSSEADQALVTYQEQKYELESAVSGSGARYTNADGTVEFWEHQGTASLEINGQVVVKDALRTDLSPAATKSIPNILQNSTWQWEQTSFENKPTIIPEQPNDFVLSFIDDSRFSATTDCNALMGQFTASAPDKTIKFSQIASTKIACPKGTQETIFSDQIKQAMSYRVTDQAQLIFTLANDGGEMMFKATSSETAPVRKASAVEHDVIIGMTQEQAQSYAEENDVLFRVGMIDGKVVPVTLDFRPGRITATIEEGLVTDYKVEQE